MAKRQADTWPLAEELPKKTKIPAKHFFEGGIVNLPPRPKDCPANLRLAYTHTILPFEKGQQYDPWDLEQRTRGQSHNPEWCLSRFGRITASAAHPILASLNCTNNTRYSKKKIRQQMELALKSLNQGMTDGEDPNLDKIHAIKWGKDHETEALMAFTRMLPEDQTVYANMGLFVHHDHPWLGCSPDGIISIPGGEDGECEHVLLEIKCPYRMKDTPDFRDIPKFYISWNAYEEAYELDTTTQMGRQYNTQIQLSLAILGLQKAILFVWGPESHIQVEVKRQPDFAEKKMVQDLSDFHNLYIAGHIREDMYRTVPIKGMNNMGQVSNWAGDLGRVKWDLEWQHKYCAKTGPFE